MPKLIWIIALALALVASACAQGATMELPAPSPDSGATDAPPAADDADFDASNEDAKPEPQGVADATTPSMDVDDAKAEVEQEASLPFFDAAPPPPPGHTGTTCDPYSLRENTKDCGHTCIVNGHWVFTSNGHCPAYYGCGLPVPAGGDQSMILPTESGLRGDSNKDCRAETCGALVAMDYTLDGGSCYLFTTNGAGRWFWPSSAANWADAACPSEKPACVAVSVASGATMRLRAMVELGAEAAWIRIEKNPSDCTCPRL